MSSFLLLFISACLAVAAYYIYLFIKSDKGKIGRRELTIHIMLIFFILWFFPSTIIHLSQTLATF